MEQQSQGFNMFQKNILPSHLGGHFNVTHIDNGVLDYMIEKYNVKSFLDIGCGPGGMCELAASKGLKVLGVDGDFTIKHKQPTIIHDYTISSVPIDESFDMAWSCEFLEHVEEKYMDFYMDSFLKAKYVVCTHALPEQPGYHHVNCQSYEYWKESFKKYGFKYSAIETLQLRNISTMQSPYFKQSGLFFVNTKI